MKPIFYASEIASLLDKNRFKSKDESMLRVMSTMPKFVPLIRRIKAATGFLTEKEIVDSAPVAIKNTIKLAVAAAVASHTAEEVQTAIETFKKSTTATLLKDALEGRAATVEFAQASDRLKTGVSTMQQEVASLQTTPMVVALTQEIQKQRGTQMEAVVEDTYAEKTGRAITARNTPARFECDEYIIVGYIDGLQNDCIVETKNRKHFWSSPPEYDLIQLKCYVKMRKLTRGLLLENFPGGSTRETHIELTDESWSQIHAGLCRVAADLEILTQSDAETLVLRVLRKTNRA